MSKYYYTHLSGSTPELIEVSVKLTPTQLSRIRSNTDSKASDSFTTIIKRLIDQNTNRSVVKTIK